MQDWLLVIVLLAVSGFALLLVFAPRRVVQFQAHLSGWMYRSLLGKSDEDISHIYVLPIGRFFISDLRTFIRIGVSQPGAFHRLIVFYRVVGLLIAAILLVAFVLLAIAVLPK